MMEGCKTQEPLTMVAQGVSMGALMLGPLMAVRPMAALTTQASQMRAVLTRAPQMPV